MVSQIVENSLLQYSFLHINLTSMMSPTVVTVWMLQPETRLRTLRTLNECMIVASFRCNLSTIGKYCYSK